MAATIPSTMKKDYRFGALEDSGRVLDQFFARTFQRGAYRQEDRDIHVPGRDQDQRGEVEGGIAPRDADYYARLDDAIGRQVEHTANGAWLCAFARDGAIERIEGGAERERGDCEGRVRSRECNTRCDAGERGENCRDVSADAEVEEHAGASRLRAPDIGVRAEDRIKHRRGCIDPSSERQL